MVHDYSYIDIVYAEQFISRDYQAYTAWNVLTNDEKQLLLNESARIIDGLFEYKGYRSTTTQVLEFPRYLQAGDTENDIIPPRVKEATLEGLLFILKTQNYENLKMADELGVKNFEEYQEIQLDDINLKRISDFTSVKLLPYTKLAQAISRG
jgi:hypothetical protein